MDQEVKRSLGRPDTEMGGLKSFRLNRKLIFYPSIFYYSSRLEEETWAQWQHCSPHERSPPMCMYELQRWCLPRRERGLPRALQLY